MRISASRLFIVNSELIKLTVVNIAIKHCKMIRLLVVFNQFNLIGTYLDIKFASVSYIIRHFLVCYCESIISRANEHDWVGLSYIYSVCNKALQAYRRCSSIITIDFLADNSFLHLDINFDHFV